MHNQILSPIIMLAREIRLENRLRARRIAHLRIDRAAGHVWHHGIAAAPGTLDVAEWVVLGRGLGEPDVAAVAAQVAGFDGVGDVFFDDDGAAGGVDEPGA